MSKEKQTKKKKSGKRTGRIFIIVVFSLIVAAVTVLVGLALISGIGSLSSSTGRVVPDEEKLRAYEESLIAAEETEEVTEVPEDPNLVKAQQLLDSMTLEEKIYQLFITSPDQLTGRIGTEKPEDLTEKLEEAPVGGLILYEANVYSAEQVTELLGGAQEAAKTPMLLGIDAEPGHDEGLSAFGITDDSEPAAVFGDNQDLSGIKAFGRKIGTDIKNVGFNLDFAPVSDTLIDLGNTEIGSRSFSSDPMTVSSMVREMIEGIHKSSVATCTKHFPGLGSTAANTNYSSVRCYRTMDELREAELIPFRTAIETETDMMMVSHVQYPAIVEGGLPASLSPIIIQEILRGELGYQGVIITDSLRKRAITNEYSSSEASVLAIQAGCDMILLPSDLEEAVNGIRAAIDSGDIREDRINESVLRILLLKAKYGLLPS